jgi:hypothetical protein
MSRTRIPFATTLAWLRTWAGATLLAHPSATTVARHTGSRC